MSQTIKNICLSVIYAGFGVILLTPIFLNNQFFFPFISTKIFLFRSIVELLVLAYVVLNIVSDEYRPRVSWLTVLIAGFMLAAAVSSRLGADPAASFWGDVERGEGLILWLHLLVFFLMLTGVARSGKAW